MTDFEKIKYDDTYIKPEYDNYGLAYIYLEEEPFEVSETQIVEIHICPNYIDLIAFSNAIDTYDPYFDIVGWGLCVTLPYEDARQFISSLDYELYDEYSSVLCANVPFAGASRYLNFCKRETWVNKESNPFEYWKNEQI